MQYRTRQFALLLPPPPHRRSLVLLLPPRLHLPLLLLSAQKHTGPFRETIATRSVPSLVSLERRFTTQTPSLRVTIFVSIHVEPVPYLLSMHRSIGVNTPVCIPVPASTRSASTTTTGQTCRQNYTSVQGDTCDSIGTKFGVLGAAILAANTFLNCNDICELA
jgi:hypothetical protein